MNGAVPGTAEPSGRQRRGGVAIAGLWRRHQFGSYGKLVVSGRILFVMC
jgi:hypothetical protein